jgi:hypothetical protein
MLTLARRGRTASMPSSHGARVHSRPTSLVHHDCARPVASSLASTPDRGPTRPSDRRSESGEQVGLGDTRALPIADEPFGAEGVPETVFGHGQEE